MCVSDAKDLENTHMGGRSALSDECGRRWPLWGAGTTVGKPSALRTCMGAKRGSAGGAGAFVCAPYGWSAAEGEGPPPA